jgi:hypothetical protein
MRFEEIENTDSNIKYISKEINYGDWPFRYLINVMFTEEWDKEWRKSGKYHVSIEVVSPVAAKDRANDVAKSYGLSLGEFEEYREYEKYNMFSEYGIKATLWQKQGNNLQALLIEARKEVKLLGMIFGFRMDAPQNAIGNTGWDFIKGEIGFKTRENADA